MNIIVTVGTVWIVDQTGEKQVARPGDVLKPGQWLVTGDDGRVVVGEQPGRASLVLEAGEVLELPLGQGDAESDQLDTLLLAQIDSNDAAETSALDEERLEEVLDAIESRQDLLDAFDDPEAGPGIGGGNNEGNSFVRLLRILEQVSPLSYEYGLNSADGQEPHLFLGDIVDGDNPGEDEDGENEDVSLEGLEGGPDGSGIAPDGDDLPGGLEGAELVVRESGLAQGSQPSTDTLQQSSSFNFDTPDGLGTLTLGGALSLTLADLQALEATPRSLDTPHGILWLDGFQGDATGGTVLYHFELTAAVDNDGTQGATGGGFLEQIDVTVTDGDGDGRSASLDVLIVDDVPGIELGGPAEVGEGSTIEGSWGAVDGADGVASLVVSVAGIDEAFALGQEIVLEEGRLTVSGDGTWSFSAAGGLDQGAAPSLSFGLVQTDGDGDQTQARQTIQILDAAGPVTPNEGGNPDAAPAEVALDEDGLDGGIAGGGGDVAGEATVITGVLGYDFGDDGPAAEGAFVWSLAGLPALSSAGELLSYTVSDDGLTLVAAMESGDEVLRIAVTDLASGAFEVTLARPLDHPENSTEDDITLAVSYTVVDSDGSQAVGGLDIRIDDDAPETITAEPLALKNGSIGDIALEGGYGADGQAGPISFAGELSGAAVEDVNGNVIMLEGSPLVWQLSDDGAGLVAVTSTGQTGFSIVLDEASGTASVATEEGELSVSTRLESGVDGISLTESTNQGVVDISDDDVDGQLVFSSANGIDISSGALGVGSGRISEGDQLRIDMVEGASDAEGAVIWDSHIRVGEFSQTVLLDGADNARASFQLRALAIVAEDGQDQFLPLSSSDFRVLDQRGIDVTSEVRVEVAGDGLAVEGLQDGWTFVVSRSEGMQALVVDGGSGEPFALGSVSVTRGASSGDAELSLALEATDSDGDQADGELILSLAGPGELLVNNNANNGIAASGGDDVIVADKGGASTIIDPAGDYNLSFILDSSSSMKEEVDTLRPDGSGNYTRLELLKASMLRQLETLADFDGTLNLQLVDFDGIARSPVVFEDFGQEDLEAARSYILGMGVGGSTNFDAGFVASKDFLAAMSEANSFESTAVFVTDGLPTVWLDDDGKVVIPSPLNPGSLAAVEESVASFQELLEFADTVHGIGIGQDSLVDYIRYFDNTDVLANEVETTLEDGNAYTGSAGEINVVNTEDDLNLALDTGSSISELEPLGSDQVFAGAGNDLVFGDTVNSDALGWVNGETEEEFASGEHDGLGYEGLYEFLKWSPEHGNGSALGSDDIKAYILSNVEALTNPERQDGGDDELYGEQGDDILIGAAGQDVLVGGQGDDILWGGLDSDRFTWESGDVVPDTPSVDRIEDFALGMTEQGDKLDLSGLLVDGASSDLSSYLIALNEGDDIVLKVKTSGGIDASGSNADLTIELGGVGSAGSGDQVLQKMLDDGQLIVD
ncbi:retention module-containing protein [Halomonas sp. DN3]|uniref:retention module-containing protein n=1 Tax=Halomonas sp. DN3 TaxID=2953657 RepID=UPI0020A1D111|nr:retention module-containing protein [Halomonas sp. DN3]USZ48002.1 retention module-containing protein [Halomonas sp. DN3]